MIKMGKGWRKWPMILFIIALLGLMFFAFGCSSDEASNPTPTTSPIQQLNTDIASLKTRVSDLEGIDNGQANSIASHTTSIANLQTNIAGYAERISNLESEDDTDLTGINASISNIIMRLTALEASAPTPTPTPTGSPTPTPTPTVQCGVQKPAVVSPAYASTSVPNGSVHFEWTTCLNAVSYEFWIGTDPAGMVQWKTVSAPTHFLDCPAGLADTYYYWKIVAVSPCGDKISDAWWFKTAP